MSIRIGEVMAQQLNCASPNTSLREVLERMRSGRHSCMPVVEGERPVGLISERDIVRILVAQLHGECLPACASDLMTSPPITIDKESRTEEAVEALRSHRIRHLLVVDEEGNLVGLVTRSDLLRAQAIALERERDLLEERVAQRTESLQELNDRLQHMSLVDPLLGIGNRRAMNAELTRLQRSAERYGRGFSVILFDIDYFKRYNDHYGHPEADAVLCEIAAVTQETIRGVDFLYRYGGEEFLVSLPETGSHGAGRAAERIRLAIAGLGIPHEPSEHGVVTVSLGVVVADPAVEPVKWPRLVNQADTALYRAKQAGRNRYHVYEP